MAQTGPLALYADPAGCEHARAHLEAELAGAAFAWRVVCASCGGAGPRAETESAARASWREALEPVEVFWPTGRTPLEQAALL